MADADSCDLAVRALFVAASELPVDGCRELNRLLTERIVVLLARSGTRLARSHQKEIRLISALRSAAEELEHPPSTTDYVRVYEQMKARGEDWPSVATILRHFRDWPAAMGAAGLTAEDPLPTHYYRSRRSGAREYTERRLTDCLQACARSYGGSPPTDYYEEWREERLAGQPGRRPLATDIPTLKTYYNRYGSWPNALRAAGLDPRPIGRTQLTDYSKLDK